MVEIRTCAATLAQGCVAQKAEVLAASSPQVARVNEMT